MRRQPALCAVEAHPAGDGRAAERPGGRLQGKLLPRDEAQDLAVGPAQPGERTCEDVVALDREKRVFRHGGAHRDVPWRRRPVVVRERPAGDRVEPRQRLGRHLVELAPADEEGLGDEVCRESRECYEPIRPRIEDDAQIAQTSVVRMRKDAKVELLRKVPLFAEASRRELSRIASIATEVEHPQGVTLIREGSRDDGFFILLEGEVDVRRKARLLRTLKRGEFFGEIGLLATIPRTASVTTGTPVEALVVSGRDFKKLLYDSPTLALKVLEALGNRLSTTALTG